MIKNTTFSSIKNNYSPKYFNKDFIANKIDNIVIFISDKYNDKLLLKITSNVISFINDIYYEGNLILMCEPNTDEKLLLVLNKIKEKQIFNKNNIKVNNSRNSIIDNIDKLKNLDLDNILFVVPSYDVNLLKFYLDQIEFSNDYLINCVKTNIINTSIYSYKNKYIIDKIQK